MFSGSLVGWYHCYAYRENITITYPQPSDQIGVSVVTVFHCWHIHPWMNGCLECWEYALWFYSDSDNLGSHNSPCKGITSLVGYPLASFIQDGFRQVIQENSNSGSSNGSLENSCLDWLSHFAMPLSQWGHLVIVSDQPSMRHLNYISLCQGSGNIMVEETGGMHETEWVVL